MCSGDDDKNALVRAQVFIALSFSGLFSKGSEFSIVFSGRAKNTFEFSISPITEVHENHKGE
jgi:hypothetical protein